MNWEAIGAIGEMAGALGVIVTLAYLAIQIRLTREHSKLESELHLSDQSAQHTQQYAHVPDLARIIEVCNLNPEALTEDERRRAMWWQAHWLYMIEGLFHRYKKGLLSDEIWVPYERVLAGLLDSEFTRNWWASDMQVAYTDSFRNYINNELAKSPPAERWHPPRL